MVNVGDHYRSTVTNKEYIVKKVIRDMVVLETPDGDGQVLTDSSSLRILYRKVEKIRRAPRARHTNLSILEQPCVSQLGDMT